MWFFKGFVQGIGALIAAMLVVAVVISVIAVPIHVCQEVFGEYGILIGWIFEMVMISGLFGAWIAYESRSDA